MPRQRSFLSSVLKGRRNTPTYYSGRGDMAGNPDILAEAACCGRPDAEWAWLRLLCFVCVSSTVGVWLWQVYFYKQAMFFKDEPWSPFKN
ncbi:hypothetical protein, conserved [Trypanosoma brucei brucei TREU927]|uniref:Uncharacterized protein n=5 Tax=Trypanozoon TaxID=39700 RepID=Q584C1_TRYB2|nr:hypothetical protein, conserved [Trypanosoma brucei brucei TREU927]AAX79023.1 hypothetical protein, conserved [Trypanosoma brucei]AAZ10857.1 hypothetical protein, conserved [Trypanosoma brucei brucei TREU927]